VRDSFESVAALLGAVNTAVTPGAVPGKTFGISDTGYLLLGAVIERASGQDYYDYMNNEVFAKAGVAAGFLRNTDDELSDRGFALGYTADGSKNWSSLPVRGTPASGAYATAPDLLSFHKALATGALVKVETLKRLVLLPPPSGQSSPGLTSGVFAGNDNGASAVFAMTATGYTVIVTVPAGGVGEGIPPDPARLPHAATMAANATATTRVFMWLERQPHQRVPAAVRVARCGRRRAP